MVVVVVVVVVVGGWAFLAGKDVGGDDDLGWEGEGGSTSLIRLKMIDLLLHYLLLMKRRY